MKKMHQIMCCVMCCIWDPAATNSTVVSSELVTLLYMNRNLPSGSFNLSSLLSHQAWRSSWLQEGWGVHEVLPSLHIEQGHAWGSCSRCWACQVDRNKAHSVPVLHKASFQLAIKQPKQRAFLWAVHTDQLQLQQYQCS